MFIDAANTNILTATSITWYCCVNRTKVGIHVLYSLTDNVVFRLCSEHQFFTLLCTLLLPTKDLPIITRIMRSLFPQLMATLGGSIASLIQLLISILATFGAFSLGTVIAWSSSALPKIEEEIVLGDAKNWVVSVVMIGAAIVPWVAGFAIGLVSEWSEEKNTHFSNLI